MRAAAHNDVKGVRRLIAQGANVNEKAKTGETPLYEAIERRTLRADNLPVVDALLNAGADPNESAIFDMAPLLLSLTREYGNPIVSLRLIHAGATVSDRCELGDGLVSLATQGSSNEVMIALLQRSSPVNCQNRSGDTALHLAALNGQADRVALLLAHGADPRLRNQDGQNALDVAATANPDRTVQTTFAKTRDLLKQAMQ